MDTGTLWRAALVQLVAAAVIFAALGLLLSKDFFETWGWVVGPLAWLGCAALTAQVLGLPRNPTLFGAVLAGIPSAIAVVFDAHTAGSLVAVALFALWCARLRVRSELVSA